VVLFGQAKRTHPIKRGCARLEQEQIKENIIRFWTSLPTGQAGQNDGKE
jgi:hypothetical protein